MTIHMKASKTDPFRLSHTMAVGGTIFTVCSVRDLQKYISKRHPATSPLFTHASEKPLTKQVLPAETRKLLSLLV